MAIYHFHTSIIKASKGKCAVASEAYISAESLYDERLGKTFSYTRKEEVVFSEILLPKNAPKHLYDRATLWNEVERVQNKVNSRYARQFDMALPIELDIAQNIELSRKFIQENFVDKGMAVDWALHDKDGNPHIHAMCTVRGFNKNGTWASMEKKEYARDENGEKIPDIDPKTGKQKVRVRKGKGVEKLWKRITVEANTWNSRTQLYEWRKNWALACNEYLSPENHIDHRSYIEQGVEKLPTVHEGYAARGLSERGVAVDVVEENKHRINLNEKHAALKLTEKKFQADLDDVKADFKNRRKKQNAKRKGIGTGDQYVKGLSENDSRVRQLNSSDAGRVKANGQGIGDSEQEDNRTAGYDKQTLFDCSRLSFIRAKISDLVDKIGTVIEVFGNLEARKSEVERISRRIAEVKAENETKKYIVPSMRAVIKSNLALAKSYFGFINRMAKIYDVKEDAGLAFRLKDDTVCYISADELGDEYTERMLRLYYLDNSLYTEIEFAIKKLLKYRHQKEKYEVCYNRYDSVENINLQINLSNIMYKYNISCYKDLTDQIVDTKLLMQELKRNKLFEKNQYTEKSEALTYLKEYTKYMDIYNKYEDLLNNIPMSEHKNIYDYMKTAIGIARKYSKYIINMVKYIYNNGVIEGINNKIKVIKRIAFGYRSFCHFRNRIHYV